MNKDDLELFRTNKHIADHNDILDFLKTITFFIHVKNEGIVVYYLKELGNIIVYLIALAFAIWIYLIPLMMVLFPLFYLIFIIIN